MKARLPLTSTFLAIHLFLSSGVYAAGSNPPLTGTSGGPQTPKGGGVVSAVVLKSWGFGSTNVVWEHLNQNWSNYGPIQVFIDHTTLHSVNTFTLQDLENSGADVVIVSDPAGGPKQWSAGEVQALQAYAQQGHTIVGTYLLFQWTTYDNRALAPLWGLRSDLAYADLETGPTSSILEPNHCLFGDIQNPLDTGGYFRVQAPNDDMTWDASDLAGATILARSADGLNVVTGYDAGNYDAYYISFMPEYQDGSAQDATQYLYNAIVCPYEPVPVENSTWGSIKAGTNR